MVDELEASASVSISRAEDQISADEGRSERMLRELNAEFGFSLPEEFRDYFAVSDHPHLRYVYLSDGEVAGGGELHLYPLAGCLLSLRDPELWYEGMSTEQIETLKTFRVIDDHPDSGDSKLAALSLLEGVSPPAEPEIFFYDRGDYFKMKVGYGGYLDGLLETMAISNWQYLLCDVDSRSPEYSRIFEKLTRQLDDLTEIFPQRDFSRFRELLEESR